MREDLRRQLAEAGRLQQSAQAKGQRQENALRQAQQETLEAVQQGNQKYATMLAEHMGIEDELNHQLASKQQAAVARYACLLNRLPCTNLLCWRYSNFCKTQPDSQPDRHTSMYSQHVCKAQQQATVFVGGSQADPF